MSSVDVFAELKRLASLIRQLQGALGGKSIKTGTDVFVFTAARNSATKTVTHGLGRVPSVIWIEPWWVPGLSSGDGAVDRSTTVPTTTQFTCRGVADDQFGAITANVPFFWAVIG